MSKKTVKNDAEAAAEQAVEQATVQSVEFIEKYKKQMIWGAAIVIVVVLGIFSYSTFYKNPKHEKSLNAMYVAEQQFRADSFAVALQGFEEVIAEYGSNAGASAYMYAGVSALQIGEFEKAIKYLKEYDGEDEILKARSIANIGDCYVGLEKYDEAVKYYKQAAQYADNIYTATYYCKAAQVLESTGKPAEALEIYKTVQAKHPNTPEGREINKYIERAKAAIK